ncbi:hypothetical protein EDB95_5019 [Dinghuibacter silviterrae]|uniref:Uncharacterized protein n=2 Tax=Dinghuibacter silviterrae TaxID=1539049 RepID=A0A4R8DI06_9BACT|nr:hypothetical protein EDB95_5019 [Dinghuibacter silviterrae]
MITGFEMWIAKKLGDKAADALVPGRWVPKHLKFHDVTLTYIYSHFDEMENHVREGGTRKVFHIEIAASIYNRHLEPMIMRKLQLEALVNGKAYHLRLLEMEEEQWIANYNIPAKTLVTNSWYAYTDGAGLNNEKGMIPLHRNNNQIEFHLTYFDERDKSRRIPALVESASALDPRFIVGFGNCD